MSEHIQLRCTPPPTRTIFALQLAESCSTPTLRPRGRHRPSLGGLSWPWLVKVKAQLFTGSQAGPRLQRPATKPGPAARCPLPGHKQSGPRGTGARPGEPTEGLQLPACFSLHLFPKELPGHASGRGQRQPLQGRTCPDRSCLGAAGRTQLSNEGSQ